MRDDKANQAEYDAMPTGDYPPTKATDRHNQDSYDVIQAQEEFDSILDPRTAALQRRATRLEEERDAWKDAHDRAVAMAKVLALALDAAMEAEGIYYGDPEQIDAIFRDLGIR